MANIDLRNPQGVKSSLGVVSLAAHRTVRASDLGDSNDGLVLFDLPFNSIVTQTTVRVNSGFTGTTLRIGGSEAVSTANAVQGQLFGGSTGQLVATDATTYSSSGSSQAHTGNRVRAYFSWTSKPTEGELEVVIQYVDPTTDNQSELPMRSL